MTSNFVTNLGLFKTGCGDAKLAAGLTMTSVNVWWLSISSFKALEPCFAAMLSSQERSRRARFIFAQDRDRFTITRGIVRTLLGHFSGRAAADISIRVGENGKPYAASSDLPEFSVSHSGDVSLIAIARTPIGVDIERIREIPEMDSIAKNHYSEAELSELSAIGPDKWQLGFLKIWTGKEAYLKAIGEGFSGSTKHFSVLLESPSSGLTFDEKRTAPRPLWKCLHFEIEGYVAAAVINPSAFPPEFGPLVFNDFKQLLGNGTCRYF